MAWHKKIWAVILSAECVLGVVLAKVEAQDPITRDVLLVVGAPGEAEYASIFTDAAERWRAAFDGPSTLLLWIDGCNAASVETKSDQERILAWTRDPKSDVAERWIVLIGHGTSDRDATKFNLRGPDLAANELAKAMEGQPCRWVIINASSSSSPFINALSAKNRVIVTATKSGAEENYSRFAEFLSKAISDHSADLDHDKSVSVLEAFLMASNQVAQFYENEGRLATEQALLDDNGDSKGTPASFYRGTRPAKAPAEGLQLDGALAARVLVSGNRSDERLSKEQLAQMEEIEQKINLLRANKKDGEEENYYNKLEELLLSFARIRFPE
jgi:hypothetical protein